jgi:hypothetical protein
MLKMFNFSLFLIFLTIKKLPHETNIEIFSCCNYGDYFVYQCKKTATNQQEEISQSTLAKIYEHGFGTSNVQRIEEGYLVEGDIVLTEEFLGQKPAVIFAYCK